ncbi:Ribonuclease H domain [Sesbania bispinosa]|nr:Ribonuclease H domain [Sesbania bispinosa]
MEVQISGLTIGYILALYLWTHVPPELISILQNLAPRLCDGVTDMFVWSNSISGVYSVNSAYHWLTHLDREYATESWNWLWKIPAPETLRFMLWLTCHNSLPTSGVLLHHGINLQGSCPRCGSEVESILHYLRDCCVVRQIWTLLGLSTTYEDTRSINLQGWLRRGIEIAGSLFLAAVWQIWISRNCLTFENIRKSHGEVVWTIVHMADMFNKVFNVNPAEINIPSVRMVSWEPPIHDQVALNTDGSVTKFTAGFGGLIRMHDGKWIRGYYGRLKDVEILEAELIAILEGLRICWSLNYRNGKCMSDSMLAVTAVSEGVPTFHKLATLVMEIKHLMNRDWTVILKHTFREGN